MFRSLRFIQKNLIWAIPILMVGGFLVGISMDATSLKSTVVPLTFLMVYPMMVPLQLKKVLEGGDFKVQIGAQFLNFVVIPFLAYGVGKIAFPDNHYAALGLLLAGLLPTSGMTISWTGMAHGNVPAAVKMTVFGLLLGSFLAPLYIKGFMGTVIEIPMIKIFQQILIVVLLPLILGNLTQRILVWRYGQARYQKDLKPLFPPFSTLGVLGIVFVAMALKAPSIANNPGQLVALLIPLAVLYVLNFGLSTVVAKVFFPRRDGIALVYGTVMRNLSIALAIAMTAFGKQGSDIALIIALAYIVQVQSAAWYVKFNRWIFGEEEEEPQVGEVMVEGVFALHDRDSLRKAIQLLSEEHIHSVAVLDGEEKPVGMATSAAIINALADDTSPDTPLREVNLEPVLIVTASTPLKKVLQNMKRTHEYKALILDKAGRVSHVLAQEDLLRRLAEE